MKEFVGLFHAPSGRPLTVAEVSAQGYARAEDGGGGVFTFPQAVEDWPLVVMFYGVFDRQEGGFPLGIYPLATAKKVNRGDRLSITFP